MKTDKINSSSTTAKELEPPSSQKEPSMTDEEMIAFLERFSVEILEAVARIVTAQETAMWTFRKTAHSH